MIIKSQELAKCIIPERMRFTMEKATVVVIGGGATGVGILRDLSMRGVNTLLVEKCDLVNGASSRYHGLLHSGGIQWKPEADHISA